MAPTSTHTQTHKGTLTYLHFITLSLSTTYSLSPGIQSSFVAATDVWRERMSYRSSVHTVCVGGWVSTRVCSEYQCFPCLTGLFHLPAYTLLCVSTDRLQTEIYFHLDPDRLGVTAAFIFQLLIAALSVLVVGRRKTG